MAFEREIRDFEIIERWINTRMHFRGSMGAHAHRVAIYADQIATFLDWKGNRVALLRWALWHDAPEVFMGDWPGPVKRAVTDSTKMARFIYNEMIRRFDDGNDWMGPQSDSEHDVQLRQIVKVADVLDEVLSIVIELRMGNELVRENLDESSKRLFERIEDMAFPQVPRGLLHQTIMAAIGRHQVTSSKVVWG